MIITDRPRTAMTASTLSPQRTTTTVVPLKQITYECSRIPDECGCSLANVVLSNDDSTNENAYLYSRSMIVPIRVNSTKHACAGTILSDSFILTTAQCVSNPIKSHDITIAAGIHSLSQYIPSIRTVAQVFIHEDYKNDATHLHDSAILRLEYPLELKTQPLCSKTCLSNIKSFNSLDDVSQLLIQIQHV